MHAEKNAVALMIYQKYLNFYDSVISEDTTTLMSQVLSKQTTFYRHSFEQHPIPGMDSTPANHYRDIGLGNTDIFSDL